MFRYRDNDLEHVPRNQLRSTDQDFGVDYGGYGFTFDVRARKGPVLIVGMQICSADGCPYIALSVLSVLTFAESRKSCVTLPLLSGTITLFTLITEGGGLRTRMQGRGHGAHPHLVLSSAR